MTNSVYKAGKPIEFGQKFTKITSMRYQPSLQGSVLR